MFQVYFMYGVLISLSVSHYVVTLRVSTAEEEVALEGSRGVLRCVYKHQNPTDTMFVVLWQKIDQVTDIPTTVFNSQSKKGESPRLRLVGAASLEIEPVNQTDEGRYRCQVTPLPSFEQDESVTELTVIYPPVFNQRRNTTLYLNEGDVTTLPCKADAKPDNITYIWYHQPPYSEEVPLNDENDRRKLRFVNGKSLYINGFIERLEGRYRCVASNEAGSNQIFFRLHLNHEAKFDGDHFRVLETLEGDDVTLQLSATAVPSNVTYKWYYEGQPIDLFGWSSYFGFQAKETMPYLRISKTENGTKLEIKEVKRLVAGSYTCSAYNGIGNEDVVNITLDVRYPAKISRHPYTAAANYSTTSSSYVIDTVVGETLVLHCFGTGNPLPWYEWKTPSFKTLSSLSKSNDDKYMVYGNGSIVVQPVEQSDAGTFTCTVSNGIGPPQKSQVDVRVLYPPHFTRMMLSAYDVIIGTDVTLPCVADSLPSPTYSWFKDSVKFTAHVTNTTSNVTNDVTSLHLINMTSTDSGSYRCHVTNYLGMIFKETKVRVHFPSNIITSSSSLRAVIGDDVNITCATSGYPVPELEWSHSHASLMTSSGIGISSMIRNGTRGRTYVIKSKRTETSLESMLMISRVGIRDFGTYYCSSSNTLGRDKIYFDLIRIDVPPPPANLKLESLNRNSIAISWSVTSDFLDGESLFCEIWLHSPMSLLLVTSCELTSCYITPLNESTTYSLYVFGRNKAGQGEKSEEIIITTFGSVKATLIPLLLNTTTQTNQLPSNTPHAPAPTKTTFVPTTTVPTSLVNDVGIRDVIYDVIRGCVRWRLTEDLEERLLSWNSSSVPRCVKVEARMNKGNLWRPLTWCAAVWTEICKVTLSSQHTWDLRVRLCWGVNTGCGTAISAVTSLPTNFPGTTTATIQSRGTSWIGAVIASTVAVCLVVLVYSFSFAHFSSRRRMMDDDVCLNFHRRRQILRNITEDVCRRSNSALTVRPDLPTESRRFRTYPGKSNRLTVPR
nr:hemicentin-1-like isoform X2 [Ciona intestinalis]|eukprot:XP_026696022.1 hemicentin-1-like isoform X2 [Ciona intestinalis]